MSKMQSGRPNRFGGSSAPSPAAVATQIAPEVAPEPTLAAVPAPTVVSAPAPAVAPAAVPAPAPAIVETVSTPEPAKKAAGTRSKRLVESTDVEVLRKYVEWAQPIEDEFQDGCDDWYGDPKQRERKRRLGRRPSDNAMVIALMRLGLESIASDPTANKRLEDLLPPDARRRRKS